jgi:hypothetical protein
MPAFRNYTPVQSTPQHSITLSTQMDTGSNFFPINMRYGKPADALNSAFILAQWAKQNVRNLDAFLCYESAFCLMADVLDSYNCPHKTIVKVFYLGFRSKELAQFRYYIRGYPFPRQFSHPLAHQERHGAAIAIYKETLFSDRELCEYLQARGAGEIGEKIGIDFLTYPARYTAIIDDSSTTNDSITQDLDNITDPLPKQPTATPTLPAHPNLANNDSNAPNTQTHLIPSSIINILAAIHANNTAKEIEEPSIAKHPEERYKSSIQSQAAHTTVYNHSRVYGTSSTDHSYADRYAW